MKLCFNNILIKLWERVNENLAELIRSADGSPLIKRGTQVYQSTKQGIIKTLKRPAEGKIFY